MIICSYNHKQICHTSHTVKDETVPLEMPQVFELANMCIEFMYELHGFYWDDFNQVVEAFTAHNDAFWSFFLVDVKEAMRINDDVIVKLQLFHTVNQYFTSQRKSILLFV